MKAIILAAGQGTRLRPLTNDKPKCMVEYSGKPIIRYIIDTIKNSGIKKTAIVNGYRNSVLESYLAQENIDWFTNEKYDSTNMVTTFFCASKYFDDDLVVSYADIIYKQEILDALISSKGDFSVVVDRNWEELWKLRMEDPLQDAETLKINNGKIIELGKKASNLGEIEGQYIGLFKISREALAKIKDYYYSLDKNSIYDGQSYDNMYMTSLIQLVIDNILDVEPVFINGGWFEIDSAHDLEIYEKKKLI